LPALLCLSPRGPVWWKTEGARTSRKGLSRDTVSLPVPWGPIRGRLMPSALDALAEAAVLQSIESNNASVSSDVKKPVVWVDPQRTSDVTRECTASNAASAGGSGLASSDGTATAVSSDLNQRETSRVPERTVVDAEQQQHQQIIGTLCQLRNESIQKFDSDSYARQKHSYSEKQCTTDADSTGQSFLAQVKQEPPRDANAAVCMQSNRERALQAALAFGFRDKDGEITRCPCGSSAYQGFMLACESCGVWQHGKCMGIRRAADAPDQYFCELCRPDLVRQQCVIYVSSATEPSKKKKSSRGKRPATEKANSTDSKSTSGRSGASAATAPAGSFAANDHDKPETNTSAASVMQRTSESTDVSSMTNHCADDGRPAVWSSVDGKKPDDIDSGSGKTETSALLETEHNSPRRSRHTAPKTTTPALSPPVQSRRDPQTPSLLFPQSPGGSLSREERKLQHILQQFQRMEAEEERRRRREAEQHNVHVERSPGEGNRGTSGCGSATDSSTAMTTATTGVHVERAPVSPRKSARSEHEAKRARGPARVGRNPGAPSPGQGLVTHHWEETETTSSNERIESHERPSSPTRRSERSPTVVSAGSAAAAPEHPNGASVELPGSNRGATRGHLASASESDSNAGNPVHLRIPLPASLSASLLGNIYVTCAPTDATPGDTYSSSSSMQIAAPRASPLARGSWLSFQPKQSSPEGGGFLPSDPAAETPHSARFGKKLWLLHQHYREQLACLVDHSASSSSISSSSTGSSAGPSAAPTLDSLPDHLEHLRIRVQQASRYPDDTLYAFLPVKKKTAAAFRLADHPVTVPAPDSLS